MFNKLEKYQINGNIVGSVSGFQVDNSDPENVVILETANIDGSNTIGGVWWIDRILSDRFTGAKQVLHAIADDTLEVGNNDLEEVYLLGKNLNSFKVKYGSNIEQMWHGGNLVNVSQLNNDANYAYNNGSNATGDLQETIAWRHVHWNMSVLNNTTVAFTNALKNAYDAKLDVEDLDGFVYNVTYTSNTHVLTFYRQNQPNIVIDLPIEQLIKGVQLVGDDLVFTFEDGSTVTVPMNTLLVGVVKSVNGKTPNSLGEIILNVTDIPNLSSVLEGKVNASGNNLTNIGTWQSNLNVLTTNTNQTGLSGNKTTSGLWRFEGLGATRLVVKRTDSPVNALQAFVNSNNDVIYHGLANNTIYAIGQGSDLATSVNDRWVWVDNTGRVFSKNGFVINGQNDTQILLAGGGHRPVSDFVLASSEIPLMSNTVIGGAKLYSNTIQNYPVQTGAQASNRTYAIQLNANGELVVNVPWFNSVYVAGTLALLQAGTNTTDRVWSASILHEYINNNSVTAEEDILFSTDFNTADVVTLNNPTVFYFTSFVDQLDFQVGNMKRGSELVVHNTSGSVVQIKINTIRQDGNNTGTEYNLLRDTTTSFILAYMNGNPYFAIKHITDFNV